MRPPKDRPKDRRIVPLTALCVASVLSAWAACAPPSWAQCEEFEATVELLQRRIESMEKQIFALQAQQASAAGVTATAPSPPAAPAPAAGRATVAAADAATADSAAAAVARQRAAAARGAGRDEALALYDRVDRLLAEGGIDEAKAELESFNTTHAGTPAASWTRSLTRELGAVGKPVPADWSIERWFQGQSDVSLDGDAPTVIVFWESWCPHCRSEVPKLQDLYERFRSRGLQVVGMTRLTRTATAESVETFIHDNAVTYPVAKETGELAEYFNVKGIPAAAVVKQGRIVWRGHPVRLTPELVESWL